MNLEKLTELESKNINVLTNGAIAAWFEQNADKTWTDVKDRVMAGMLRFVDVNDDMMDEFSEVARVVYGSFKEAHTNVDDREPEDAFMEMALANKCHFVQRHMGGALWRFMVYEDGCEPQACVEALKKVMNRADPLYAPDAFDFSVVDLGVMNTFIDLAKKADEDFESGN